VHEIKKDVVARDERGHDGARVKVIALTEETA
jgi:hypothetical protein